MAEAQGLAAAGAHGLAAAQGFPTAHGLAAHGFAAHGLDAAHGLPAEHGLAPQGAAAHGL
ncbi:hypothetical protein [Thalassospira lucentensis]|uniref:hypothetical protein n=1 Tax=Thalassospira lucentensis TaxID=168935 RepID=UPI003AA8CC0A